MKNPENQNHSSSKNQISAEARRQRKRRKTLKRSEIYLTKAEHNWLSDRAKKYGSKLAPFIKECAIAYHKKLFILPDRNVLHDLKMQLIKIGTNINQIAYVANRDREIQSGTHETLINRVRELEKNIEKALTYPDDLESLIKQALKERPSFIVTLQYLLDNHQEK